MDHLELRIDGPDLSGDPDPAQHQDKQSEDHNPHERMGQPEKKSLGQGRNAHGPKMNSGPAGRQVLPRDKGADKRVDKRVDTTEYQLISLGLSSRFPAGRVWRPGSLSRIRPLHAYLSQPSGAKRDKKKVWSCAEAVPECVPPEISRQCRVRRSRSDHLDQFLESALLGQVDLLAEPVPGLLDRLGADAEHRCHLAR